MGVKGPKKNHLEYLDKLIYFKSFILSCLVFIWF